MITTLKGIPKHQQHMPNIRSSFLSFYKLRAVFRTNYIILYILSIVKSLSIVKCFLVIKMISYKPFYETLFRKNITEYSLIFKQGFSANTLHRIKKGEAISTRTLDALCYALDCDVDDIICFEKE